MRIGFIGLGILGAVYATAIAYKGHDVLGYDIDLGKMIKKPRGYQETGPDATGNFDDYFINEDKLNFANDLKEVADFSDMIFVCVSTPHNKEYEGITIAPKETSDFKYDYLVSCIEDLSKVVKKDTPIVVISTVLPTTMKTYVKPLLNEHMKLVYSPATPANGNFFYDILNQEFFIVGVDDEEAAKKLVEFYPSICECPIRTMSVESAELCKMVYNTYITQKISYSQSVMEMCYKIPEANVDDILTTIQMANRRLMSPSYMNAGMHDGGGCHPRDLIALSHLSQELELSYDWFGQMVRCREEQMGFIAGIVADEYDAMFEGEWFGPEVVICGYTFKKESNITTGSSALLCKYILENEWGYTVKMYDPKIDGEFDITRTSVFLIGMNHDEIPTLPFPEGSVIVDPFRFVGDIPNCKVIRVGE
jgi:UDPglucose 6-dehydrogenase